MNPFNYVNVDTLPEKYRCVFPKYRSFNRVQSALFPTIFDSDNSIVVSAPTSSGKTVIFELAIINYLIKQEFDYGAITNENCRIVMVAPMKAICNERYRDWTQRFASLNLTILLLTGTTDTRNGIDLNSYNIIITTPEKWDSIMRLWNVYQSAIQSVGLFMIDEVQLVGDKSRGPTLEAIVSRMKTMRLTPNSLRIVAATATASNIQDVAKWLGANGRHCQHFSFDDSTRPVPLKMLIFGYPINHKGYFKFDITLNYKLINLIIEHSKGKPSLVFCCTRNGVEMAAKQLSKSLSAKISIDVKEFLYSLSNKISHPQAQELIKCGIGIHHAGILENELQLIEDAFRMEKLPVLVTTTTLSMGVNLPAHLVIIKGTKMYVKGEFQSYSDSQIQQMIGRAGRPQYDTEAVAIIMTTHEDKQKYDQMLLNKIPLESGLHLHLIEHLNSEISLRTLTDLATCIQWLSTTFLYVRAPKNPKYYGILVGLTEEQMDRKLTQFCQIEINKLVAADMVTLDEDAGLTITFLGELMAKHYLQFETVKNFTKIRGNESVQEILNLVAKSKEFEDYRLRVSEKKVLNALNSSKLESIRFPMTGKVKNVEMKINCLIQAVLGCIPIVEPGLSVESEKIIKSADSIVRCMSDYLTKSYENYSKLTFIALHSTQILSKCLRAKLWENSNFVARQFPGVGIQRARILSNMGKTSFASLALAGPNALNNGLRTNIGDKLIALAKTIPKYELELKIKSKLTNTNQMKYTLELIIILINKNELFESVINPSDQMLLLVGNTSTNQILFQSKYSHNYMLEICKLTKEFSIIGHGNVKIVAYYISSSWVGFDTSAEITLQFPSLLPLEINSHQTTIEGKTKANTKTIKQPKKTLNDYFEVASHKSSSSSSGESAVGLGKQVKPKTPIQKTISETFKSVKNKPQSVIKRVKPTITIEDILSPELYNNIFNKKSEKQNYGLVKKENENLQTKSVSNRPKKNKITVLDIFDFKTQTQNNINPNKCFLDVGDKNNDRNQQMSNCYKSTQISHPSIVSKQPFLQEKQFSMTGFTQCDNKTEPRCGTNNTNNCFLDDQMLHSTIDTHENKSGIEIQNIFEKLYTDKDKSFNFDSNKTNQINAVKDFESFEPLWNDQEDAYGQNNRNIFEVNDDCNFDFNYDPCNISKKTSIIDTQSVSKENKKKELNINIPKKSSAFLEKDFLQSKTYEIPVESDNFVMYHESRPSKCNEDSAQLSNYPENQCDAAFVSIFNSPLTTKNKSAEIVDKKVYTTSSFVPKSQLSCEAPESFLLFVNNLQNKNKSSTTVVTSSETKDQEQNKSNKSEGNSSTCRNENTAEKKFEEQQTKKKWNEQFPYNEAKAGFNDKKPFKSIFSNENQMDGFAQKIIKQNLPKSPSIKSYRNDTHEAIAGNHKTLSSKPNVEVPESFIRHVNSSIAKRGLLSQTNQKVNIETIKTSSVCQDTYQTITTIPIKLTNTRTNKINQFDEVDVPDSFVLNANKQYNLQDKEFEERPFDKNKFNYSNLQHKAFLSELNTTDYQRNWSQSFNQRENAAPSSNYRHISKHNGKQELVTFRRSRSGIWNNETEVATPPCAFALPKKRKLHHTHKETEHTFTWKSSVATHFEMSMNDAGPSKTFVCDRVTKTKKSLMWNSPLVSEREISYTDYDTDNDNDLSFKFDSTNNFKY